MPERFEIAVIDGKGRGVRAGRAFRCGELLERAPVVFVGPEYLSAPKNGNLDSYYFRWPDGRFVLALGTSSLFNHSATPNVRFEKSVVDDTIAFLAARDISRGEELLIDYCQDRPNDRALWFVPTE